jgi:hypothetical protein
LVPGVWSQEIDFAEAKVSIKPDAAFKSLVKAREELQFKRVPSVSNGSLNINNYGTNAGALLASK